MAVINFRQWPAWALAIFYAVFGMSLPLMAAILPDERLDILYHRYSGDQVTVDGPSILGRKSLGKHTSVYANYYTDSVSSASIDVRTYASPYTEDRKEYSIGVDTLFDNSTISLGFTNSEENDYSSDTYHFSTSHTMFGDLTTVDLGFSLGNDQVRKNSYDADGKYAGNDPGFGSEALTRRNYSVGLTQIFTKNLIMNFAFEAVSDEGFTRNPYRSALMIDNTNHVQPTPEEYPGTRTSDAIAIRANYYLPYRAALKFEYKYYQDSWDITAHTYKIGYTHPFSDRWTWDFHYRVYQQDQASFYYDIMPRGGAVTIVGRDKELSAFSSQGIGVGASYEFWQNGWWQLDKGSVSFSYERVSFDYDNFSDYEGLLGTTNTQGRPFAYSADVLEIYFSVWY
ncbi:MAG: DUF3570 domain-containing protein [Gammaproteobacteria bacterium]